MGTDKGLMKKQSDEAWKEETQRDCEDWAERQATYHSSIPSIQIGENAQRFIPSDHSLNQFATPDNVYNRIMTLRESGMSAGDALQEILEEAEEAHISEGIIARGIAMAEDEDNEIKRNFN